jgi:guanine deaminase
VCVLDGRIAWVEHVPDAAAVPAAAAAHGLEWEATPKLVVGDGEGFICPGFVDTHTVSPPTRTFRSLVRSFTRFTRSLAHSLTPQHAPQYPNNGLGHSLQLLDWLRELTFPLEQKFSDETFARGVYERVVARNLGAGVSLTI